MTAQQPHRVVVTGMGVIAAIGESVPRFEAALFKGQCGVRPITLFDVSAFPCRYGGQVQREDLTAGFNRREIKRASRCDLLGLIAAREAVADAGLLDSGPHHDWGIILGGGAGGMRSWETYRRAQHLGRRPGPGMLLSSQPCTLSDRVGLGFGIGGYRATVTTACSSSTTAIGMAYDLIRTGRAAVALTGGSESLCELTFGGFNTLRVMDTRPCRPFDRERQGLSLGEGAAILVLESYERAVERGARIYAEICGYAVNSDAYHITAPHPEAAGMSAVMRRAMDRARVTPQDVDYINAHGTATRVNDPLETGAIKKVFGETRARELAVSSTKSMVGHCLGAAGGIEAVAAILAVHHQKAPPTAGLARPDPACDLNYVPGRAVEKSIRYALSNSFAFGGNNSCVVLGSVDQ